MKNVSYLQRISLLLMTIKMFFEFVSEIFVVVNELDTNEKASKGEKWIVNTEKRESF